MSSEVKILLYIIGGIIYFFVISFKKEKKKQNEKQINKRPSTTKSAQDIYDELKKAMNLNTEKAKPIPKPSPLNKKIPIKVKKSTKSDNYNDYFTQKALKASTNHKAINQNIEVNTSENIILENIIDLENFDYKKAVIFSEILKKPQY